jgi:hypothetical protein
MFNFLRKKKNNVALPERYQGLVAECDYALIIDCCKKYFDFQDSKLISWEEGNIIVSSENDQEKHYYLDNLIRYLAGIKKIEWEREIYAHFDKLKDQSNAYDYLFKNLSEASKHLAVIIKPEGFFSDKTEQFVNRIDFPETRTFLMFDFQEQFSYISRDDIVEWDKSEGELFEIALHNVSHKTIEVNEYLYHEKFVVYSFFSGDFSSSLMIELVRLSENFTGIFGSLVAIPTKGTSFLHPINSSDLLELICTLYPIIEKFYNEDPGNITTKMYWHHKGCFKPLIYEYDQATQLHISLPKELEDLMR